MTCKGVLFQLSLIYLTFFGINCIPVKKSLLENAEKIANASFLEEQLSRIRLSKFQNIKYLEALLNANASGDQHTIDLPVDLIKAFGDRHSENLSKNELDSLRHKAAMKDKALNDEEAAILEEIKMIDILDSWQSIAEDNVTRAQTMKPAKLKQPGSRAQELESWEQSNDLDKEYYDPSSYFKLFDYNSDELLDSDEVESAMFQEAKRLHPSSTPDAHREALKMTEYVFEKIDTNKDRYVSLEEHNSYISSMQGQEDADWENEDPLMQVDNQLSEENLNVLEKEVEKLQSDAPDSEILTGLHAKIDKLQMDLKSTTAVNNISSI